MKTPLVPELLSPAGGLETALAAFDGGADAVYCGLGKFNARMRAENFDRDRLGRLLRFAGEHGKKVYLTLNTLIREEELPEVMTQLAELALLRPDALIVQDPGVALLAKRYFPELVLHASTQMNIHNSAGVAAAARMGFRRVILERQVSLEELRLMAPRCPVELEVFIHGSLCCSLSGRCLLSSRLFGLSGNRGQCRQPCRNRYNGKYLLSPADLDGVAVLPELRRIGVASLKIEGRLRSPGYVWKTARAYRLLLDGPVDPEPERLQEARILLDSAAGRDSSSGFYDMGGAQKLIRADRTGSFGQPAGTVQKQTARGILLHTTARLHLGDRLRVFPPEGGEGESFSLIRMEYRGTRPLKVSAGCDVFLPGNYPVRPGWLVSKIGENGFDFSRRAAALPPVLFPLPLRIRITGAELEVSTPSLPRESWKKAVSFSPAHKSSCTEETVFREFAAGAPPPWKAVPEKAELEPGLFVPASVLKTLRREFWEWAAPRLAPPQAPWERLEAFYEHCRCRKKAASESLVPPAGAVTVPAFLPETKLDAERQRLAALYEGGARDFIVSSWHALELLQGFSGVRLYAEFPLPVCNSMAAELLAEYGVCAAGAEAELPLEDVEALKKNAPIPIFRASGEVPLLVTRLPLPAGGWKDDFSRKFRAEYDKTEGVSKLYRMPD